MAQLNIISGSVATKAAEFRTSYPQNLEPVIGDTGVSKAQLRTAAGATSLTTGPGTDRAAFLWGGMHYRIMGTKLVCVDATAVTVTTLGDVGGSGYAAMDGGFDRLAVASNGNLFYYFSGTVQQVTDPDLGTVIDMIWVDGYFMFTDGTYVGVTELDDPFQVKPLKYGSAEDNPDPITGLIRVPGSADTNVVGRYTIQVFQDIGGNGFPFKSVEGATIPFGCVAPSAKCLFGKTFAFVGGAVNEAIGVFVAGQGDASRISTKAVDDALAAVADPTAIVCESRTYGNEARLLVRLPTETWVFLARASEKAQEPVWVKYQSGIEQPYRPINALNDGRRWVVGDANSMSLGVLDEAEPRHFGEIAEWRFDVGMLYSFKAGVLGGVELIGLPGRGGDGTISLSLSRDGTVWGVERAITLTEGRRNKRMTWRPGVRISPYLGMRFKGYGDALAGISACEVE